MLSLCVLVGGCSFLEPETQQRQTTPPLPILVEDSSPPSMKPTAPVPATPIPTTIPIQSVAPPQTVILHPAVNPASVIPVNVQDGVAKTAEVVQTVTGYPVLEVARLFGELITLGGAIFLGLKNRNKRLLMEDAHEQIKVGVTASLPDGSTKQGWNKIVGP